MSMTDACLYGRAVVMHRLKRAYDFVTCADARRILLEPLWPVLALVLVAVFGAMTSARAAQSSAAGTADPQTASDGNNTDETVLAEIVVTATRIPQSSFDLPVSVNSVSQRRIQEGQL